MGTGLRARKGASRSARRVGHSQRKDWPRRQSPPLSVFALPRCTVPRCLALRLSLRSWGRDCWPQGQYHELSPISARKRPVSLLAEIWDFATACHRTRFPVEAVAQTRRDSFDAERWNAFARFEPGGARRPTRRPVAWPAAWAVPRPRASEAHGFDVSAVLATTIPAVAVLLVRQAAGQLCAVSARARRTECTPACTASRVASQARQMCR
jgi:hypothetical protein